MREIKFRAWDKDNEKMIPDWHLDDRLIEHYGFSGGDRFILAQYTGLKDKDGVEIYEGDIIGKSSKERQKHTVEWEEPNSCGCCGQSSGWNVDIDYLDIYIVLGNIYKNPDLLINKKT